MWQRQDGQHPGARRVRIDLQSPAELLHALAHGPDADATLFNVPWSSHRESAANVADFQLDVGVGLLEPDSRRRASRVAMNVREAFLRQAENGNFQLPRQP